MGQMVTWPSGKNIVDAHHKHSQAVIHVRRWVVMKRFWTYAKDYKVAATDAAVLVSMLDARSFEELLACWRRSDVAIVVANAAGEERLDNGNVRKFFWVPRMCL